MFEGGPRRFEEQPVLRVGLLGLARTNPEERGIELIGVRQDRAGLYVVRIAQQGRVVARSDQFLIGERSNRFDAVTQITPELIDVRRAGKRPAMPTIAIDSLYE